MGEDSHEPTPARSANSSSLLYRWREKLFCVILCSLKAALNLFLTWNHLQYHSKVCGVSKILFTIFYMARMHSNATKVCFKEIVFFSVHQRMLKSLYVNFFYSLHKNIKKHLVSILIMILNVSCTPKHIRMTSEGSCDTEDWSNVAENFALPSHGKVKFLNILK